MTKRHYESVVIINAALEDDKVDEVIKKIEKTLTDGNAEITDIDRWGRKRLAYPIKKAKTGYYVVIRFKAEPSFISKLDRFFRLEEKIFRSLTVLLDKEALNYIEKKKAEAAKDEVSTVIVNNEENVAENVNNKDEEVTPKQEETSNEKSVDNEEQSSESVSDEKEEKVSDVNNQE